MLSRLVRYYIVVVCLIFSAIFLADYAFQRVLFEQNNQQISLNLFIDLVKVHCQKTSCNKDSTLPIDSLKLLELKSLSLPQKQYRDIHLNKTIQVEYNQAHYFYHKLSPTTVLEIGPIERDNKTDNYIYSITFYTLLGLAFLLILWPLYKDIWQIKEATEKFTHSKDLASLTLPDSKYFKPVSDTINWMIKKIARLLALQNELSGTLSHELRTNLSRLKFTLAGISDKNIIESTKLLKQDVAEIQSLVDQYLNFSKQEHETPKLKLTQATLAKTVTSYLEQLGVYSTIRYEFEIKSDPIVEVDLSFLTRAIKNLLENAFKYTHDQVKVTLRNKSHFLELIIEDNGIGVQSSEIEDLFLPYTRNHHNKLGYGLGLAITKKIVNWHNGEICVSRSECLGGAKFVMRIPIRSCHITKERL